MRCLGGCGEAVLKNDEVSRVMVAAAGVRECNRYYVETRYRFAANRIIKPSVPSRLEFAWRSITSSKAWINFLVQDLILPFFGVTLVFLSVSAWTLAA